MAIDTDQLAVLAAASPRILVVDDSELALQVLKNLLADAGFRHVTTTTDSSQVTAMCRSLEADVLLLDLHMPGADGFAVLEEMSASACATPVILLTADVRPKVRREAFALGAADFITKPFDPTEVLLRLRNVLAARRRVDYLEREVGLRTRDLEHARLELLHRLALASEFRDDDTHQHTQRVGRTACLLASRLAPEMAEHVLLSAPLHDIGKLGIPDAILLKPGQLTDAEYELMKSHTDIGRRILADSSSPVLAVGAEIAGSHHERWDGRGYPLGLSGEEIPLAGRITAVADAYDAMTHDRPYRAKLPVSAALDELRRMSGEQFDPRVVAAFEGLDHSKLLSDVPRNAPPPPRDADLPSRPWTPVTASVSSVTG